MHDLKVSARPSSRRRQGAFLEEEEEEEEEEEDEEAAPALLLAAPAADDAASAAGGVGVAKPSRSAARTRARVLAEASFGAAWSTVRRAKASFAAARESLAVL